MTIEILPPSAWWQLESIFEEHGVQLPDPELARIIIARDEDVIAGFVVIQLQPHIEPLYVDESYRHKGLANELADAAVALFPPGTAYFAFSPREGISSLAEKSGLQQLPWKVYRGMN